MTKDQVIETVGAVLANQSGPKLTVLSDEVQISDNGWWYVPVYSTPRPQRLYDLYDALAAAEEKLDWNIQLIPDYGPEEEK